MAVSLQVYPICQIYKCLFYPFENKRMYRFNKFLNILFFVKFLTQHWDEECSYVIS